jgi:DNA-binding XRE family transcriptional regulator
LSNNLQAVRKSAGKTQSDVAAVFGVQKSTISAWEKQKELPAWAIPKLMAYFHCDEKALTGSELVLNDEGPQYRTSPVLDVLSVEQLF